MKTILVMGLLTLSSTAFTSVVKSYDQAKSCNLYRVVNETTKPKQTNESVVYAKEVYGLALEDLEVDFDNREAKAQVIMNIVMGVNRVIVAGKSSMEETNPQFNFLINQVNRKLSLLEKICLSGDNKIIYAKSMDSK